MQASQTFLIGTMFSGVDCAYLAWRILSAACILEFGFALDTSWPISVENCPAAQKTPLENYPDRCLFPDIMDRVTEGKGPRGGYKAKKKAWCKTHNRDCPVSPDLKPGQKFGNVSGPPCVLFSNLGQHDGFTNAEKKKVHDAYIALIKADKQKAFRCFVCLSFRIKVQSNLKQPKLRQLFKQQKLKGLQKTLYKLVKTLSIFV